LLGPFEEEEEGIGMASDVVKVEGEDPATRLGSEVFQNEDTPGP